MRKVREDERRVGIVGQEGFGIDLVVLDKTDYL